jgi:hypothetical protein
MVLFLILSLGGELTLTPSRSLMLLISEAATLISEVGFQMAGPFDTSENCEKRK